MGSIRSMEDRRLCECARKCRQPPGAFTSAKLQKSCQECPVIAVYQGASRTLEPFILSPSNCCQVCGLLAPHRFPLSQQLSLSGVHGWRPASRLPAHRLDLATLRGSHRDAPAERALPVPWGAQPTLCAIEALRGAFLAGIAEGAAGRSGRRETCSERGWQGERPRRAQVVHASSAVQRTPTSWGW